MNNIVFRFTLLLGSLSFHLDVKAQVATSVGLELKTDSADHLLMPKIIRVTPSSAADAEPEIHAGMYLVKVDETYCRNAPLSKITDLIEYGDEEATPVALYITADKNEIPKQPFVLRRGKPAPKPNPYLNRPTQVPDTK